MKIKKNKIFEWLNAHLEDIILIIGVILISLFSFAIGYFVAKEREKTPLKIEYESGHRWCRYYWSLFGPQAFRNGT